VETDFTDPLEIQLALPVLHLVQIVWVRVPVLAAVLAISSMVEQPALPVVQLVNSQILHQLAPYAIPTVWLAQLLLPIAYLVESYQERKATSIAITFAILIVRLLPLKEYQITRAKTVIHLVMVASIPPLIALLAQPQAQITLE
jgi:hypothetical protein